jgi:hypothetical protein
MIRCGYIDKRSEGRNRGIVFTEGRENNSIFSAENRSGMIFVERERERERESNQAVTYFYTCCKHRFFKENKDKSDTQRRHILLHPVFRIMRNRAYHGNNFQTDIFIINIKQILLWLFFLKKFSVEIRRIRRLPNYGIQFSKVWDW